MNAGRWLHLLFTVVLLTSSPSTAWAEIERYTGVAYGPGGRVLYREQHEVVEDDGRLESAVTTYLDPDGRTIGRLESDYRRSAFAPDYSFLDLRTGKRESARNEGASIVLRYGDQEKRYPVSRDEIVVLGQGMHQFVRANLERLAKETVSVRFGIPSRLDTYGFRIRPIGRPSQGVVRLRIESDSWLIRTLAPHLEVDYELSTRRLLRYEGVSNLDGPGGETQKVVIVYNYGDRR